MRRLSFWVALVVTMVGSAAGAVGCWFQTSFVGWLTTFGIFLVLLLLTVAYDRPGRHLLPRPLGWVYLGCGVVGLASLSRLPVLDWPHVTSMSMGGVVTTYVVVAYVVFGLREPGSDAPTESLTFPLSSGRWAVITGGVRILNHHLAAPTQVGALDLIAVRPDGARASGVCPIGLEAYQAYGRSVVSPCAGIVVVAVDGQPDQPPQHIAATPPSGNHVRIDTGHAIVHLAHLRLGSLRVAVGDTVAPGQPIGEVGNSGRSTEPHLHIHVEHDGRGARLRFVDLPRRFHRLRPGLTVLAPAAADVRQR